MILFTSETLTRRSLMPTYRSRSASSAMGDWVASEATASLLLLTVAALVLVVTAAIRGGALVTRVIRRHPRHRILRLALIGCGVSWLLVGLLLVLMAASPTTFVSALAAPLTLAGLTTAVLLLTAKLIDRNDGDRFLREPSKEAFIEDVLPRAWWPATSERG